VTSHVFVNEMQAPCCDFWMFIIYYCSLLTNCFNILPSRYYQILRVIWVFFYVWHVRTEVWLHCRSLHYAHTPICWAVLTSPKMPSYEPDEFCTVVAVRA